MALSANATYVTKSGDLINVPVKTGATIYNGALLMDSSGATPYDGTIGAILLGWHFGDVNDDASTSPTKTAKIARGGFGVLSLTVAGLGGTIADVGLAVYATDDGTYTITNGTTHTVRVGTISRFVSATVADVQMVADIFGTAGV